MNKKVAKVLGHIVADKVRRNVKRCYAVLNISKLKRFDPRLVIILPDRFQHFTLESPQLI